MSWGWRWKRTGEVLLSSFRLHCTHNCQLRSRALSSKDETEADVLRDRWETAHNICSLITLKLAFEDCKEGGKYDLG